jgi:RHS repeat-associated protein
LQAVNAEDMLVSSRAIVQAGQTALCYDGDFHPFGGERIVTNTCAQNYKFEGKERDTETGNDDFGARYYSFRLGRWLSADWSSVPVPVPYANLTNPQTLNLYAMVSDNPETFADLDGHNCTMETSYVTCAGEDTGESGVYGVGTEADLKQQQKNKQLGAMQQAQYQLSQKGLEFIARHEVVQKVKQAAAAVEKARAAEQAWLAKHPNVEALIMIGAMISGGGEAAEGEGEAAGEVGEGLQYSDRVAARSAQDPGPNHNFPSSFDNEIIQNGQKTVGSNGYTQYNLRGSINGKEGTYEIGVQNGQIVHRFFRPNP